MQTLIVTFLVFAVSTGFSQVADSSHRQKARDMAEKYGISSDSAQYLKDHYNIGYGGVSHALSLARHEAQLQKKMERALAKQERRQNRGKK